MIDLKLVETLCKDLKLNGESLRIVSLFFATWKLYRTAASSDQTIQAAMRIETYIKTGDFKK